MHSHARVFRDRNPFLSRNLVNCARARPKSAIQNASFTFGRDLQPKAREQNFATESSSVGKCQGYRKEAWLLRWDNELWSIGSNRWVKVGRGQLWSDQSPSWTQQVFLTATVCLRPKFFQMNRAREYTYWVKPNQLFPQQFLQLLQMDWRPQSRQASYLPGLLCTPWSLNSKKMS